ncbi:MAG: hypothetical protein KKC68_05265 [Candidatus Thermoplasmatota archaeon]|nr:hypothetical protein [Candidatus Thermoplasmatota archaeon]
MWRKKQQTHQEPPPETTTSPPPYDHITTFLDDLPTINPTQPTDTITPLPPQEPTKKHRKHPLHTLKGKPIFLQENGQQIGTILDELRTTDNTLKGFTIKDPETNDLYTLPITQVDINHDGVIYLPSWYTKSLTFIKQLEFYDHLNPDLKWILTDKTTTTEDIYHLYIQNDTTLHNHLKQTRIIINLLTNRKNLLLKERTIVKHHIMDHIEERLIKNIDRKNFTDKIQHLREKATLLDIQITRCTELLNRLSSTSLGHYLEQTTTLQDTKPSDPPRDDMLKKYTKLEHDYHQLLEQHTQLKKSIEKLIDNNLLE